MTRSARWSALWCLSIIALVMFCTLFSNSSHMAAIEYSDPIPSHPAQSSQNRPMQAKHVAQAPLKIMLNPVPRMNFSIYAAQPPLNHEDESGNVFALLLCPPTTSIDDATFAATQQIVFRLLWQFRSIHQVVVFVCPLTTHEQRTVLLGQGAVVREIQVPLRPSGDEMLAHLWNATEYNKIAYLATDAFPMSNIDDAFDLAQDEQCQSPSKGNDCTVYTFAAVKDDASRTIDSGFMVLSPSESIYQALTQKSIATDRDQALHNPSLIAEAFRLQSGRSAQHLPIQWNYRPTANLDLKTLAEVKILRSKIWDPYYVAKESLLRDMWDLSWLKQCRWYDGIEFYHARETGIYRTQFSIFVETLALLEEQDAAEEAKDSQTNHQ